MRTLLAFLGYVKVPLAAVQLSIEQEVFLTRCAQLEADTKGRVYFLRQLQGQQTLTKFLRTGRLLNG